MTIASPTRADLGCRAAGPRRSQPSAIPVAWRGDRLEPVVQQLGRPEAVGELGQIEPAPGEAEQAQDHQRPGHDPGRLVQVLPLLRRRSGSPRRRSWP